MRTLAWSRPFLKPSWCHWPASSPLLFCKWQTALAVAATATLPQNP
jgi:hypothetical protein